MIKTGRKKTPADYPSLSIRLPLADQKAILKEIDEAQELLNTVLAKDQKAVTKGKVVAEALKVGLAAIKRTPKKFIS